MCVVRVSYNGTALVNPSYPYPKPILSCPVTVLQYIELGVNCQKCDTQTMTDDDKFLQFILCTY